jgi:protocatechuate 3,4-dioxygenase beta subunit
MVSSGRHAIFCILLVLSTVIFTQAQNAPDKTSGATITGKVTIKGKGAPGVAVVLVQNVEGSQRVTRHKAFTDDTGTYRLTNVPPGNYSAIAAAPAFVAAGGSQSPFGKSVTLLINKDETVENIDFELLRGGVITGRVTDSDGHPLIEETVSLSSVDSNGGYVSRERGTRTDDRGVYRIFGIPPGNYKVAAGTNEITPRWERSAFRQTFHPDATDASQATIINVTEGSETTNVDITIKGVGRTYSVRGRIIDGDTGRPVANVPYGISVYVNPNTRSGLSDGSVSNSDGEFKWENLRPGKYAVFVNTPSDSDWYAEEAPFEVTDRDVTGLVVKTVKSTVVSGVISLEGTDDKSVLAKLSGVQVSGRIINENRTTTIGGTLSDGRFRFNNLPAGVVTFEVDTKGFELVRVELNGVVQPAGIPIREREQISGLRLVVHYYNASIRGVLKVDDNASLPANAKFYVSLKKIGEPVRQFDQSSSDRSAAVDARGQFVAEGLSPGTYEVTGWAHAANEPRGKVLSGKQQVTVTDGAVVNITLTLQSFSLPNRP